MTRASRPVSAMSLLRPPDAGPALVEGDGVDALQPGRQRGDRLWHLLGARLRRGGPVRPLRPASPSVAGDDDESRTWHAPRKAAMLPSPERMRAPSPWRAFAQGALLLLTTATAARAASVPPDLHFRTLEGRRATVIYHQGLEAMAREASALSDLILDDLVARYGNRVGRVRVVLADSDDDPNGYATPLPYPLVNIRAVSPNGADDFGNLESWLRLVLTHELAHVVHLEPARGVVGFCRKLLGRAPYLFPNIFTPTWMIEGLAVYEETEGTAFGRGRNPDSLMVRRAAAREGRFPSEDQAVFGLDEWPGGQASYLFGEGFVRHLSDSAGPDVLPRLQKVQSRQIIPYLDDWTSSKVTGASFHSHWKEWKLPRGARREPGGDGPGRPRAHRLASPDHAGHPPDRAPLQPGRGVDRLLQQQPKALSPDPARAPGRHRGPPPRRPQRRGLGLLDAGRPCPGLRRDRGAPHLLPHLRPAPRGRRHRTGAAAHPGPARARARRLARRPHGGVRAKDGGPQRALHGGPRGHRPARPHLLPPRDRVGRSPLQPRRRLGRGFAAAARGMARRRGGGGQPPGA